MPLNIDVELWTNVPVDARAPRAGRASLAQHLLGFERRVAFIDEVDRQRTTCAERVREFARLLRPGGVFRFASDIDDYTGWTLARVLPSPFFTWSAERAQDWVAPWPGFTRTRYEEKAIREGRTTSYLTFVRTDVSV